MKCVENNGASVSGITAWHGLMAALLIAGPLYVLGTFGHDLWRPAEAREAGIAREMIETGNWVATYLNGHLFLEKPPLYTWTIALPLKLLGYQDWVVRIPVFIFTMGTLMATYALALRQMGPAGAQGALISLATMWLFMEVNHGAMIDNGLVFFITLAMLAFYCLWDQDKPAIRWAVVFYLNVGLAFLCKGGIGPALILAATGGFILSGRHWGVLRSLYPVLGLAILILMIGGWLWALWLKGGETYFRVFFIENHLYRFQGKAGPVAEWFYYLPYMLVATFPWVFLVPAGLWVVWTQRREGDSHCRRYWNFIFWWIGAMLALLSAAGTKDNQYLLPLLPPLAIICGAWVEQTLAGKRYPHWCLSTMWIFCGVVVLGIAVLSLAPMMVHKKLSIGGIMWTLALGIIGVGVLRALQRCQWRAVWAGLALLTVGAGCILGLFIEKLLNDIKSSKPLCGIIRETVPPGAALWGYDLGENTEGFLIFYGWRPQRVVSLEDAVSLGRQADPTFLLMVSRNKRHEFADQLIKTDPWRVVRTAHVGSRFYWLFGNKAADVPPPFERSMSVTSETSAFISR